MREYREVVEAELLLDLAPEFADIATFAIHRPGKTELDWLKKKWFIANVETGTMVVFADSRKEAIHKAKERLKASTREQLLEAMDRCEAVMRDGR